MNEIEKEIEKINPELIAITSDSINQISGERICSFRAGRIRDFLHNALLRTEKRVREERDKEILEWVQYNSFVEYDGDRGQILSREIKDFINKNHE